MWSAVLSPYADPARSHVRPARGARRRQITFIHEDPDHARQRMITDGTPEPITNRLLATWAAAVGHPTPVSPAVEQITGHAPRSFAQWVNDHLNESR